MAEAKNNPFLNWDSRTANRFRRLLIDYQSIPASNKLLSTMIKFETMYRPLTNGPFRIDPFNSLRGENEYREIKRAQLYLAKKDLIKIVDRSGGKKLILTSRAQRVFYQELPLAKLRNTPWNGRWTIVMYDFPERLRGRRNDFRRRLIDLGFGSPQESVLVTPLAIEQAIKELVDGEEIANLVWILTAKRVLGMDNREVAAKAWNLSEINTDYTNLLSTLPAIKRSPDHQLKKKWGEYFLALDAVDPYLPKELLPADWTGERCHKEFIHLKPKTLVNIIFH